MNTGETEKEIIRRACSDPRFIIANNIIIKFCEREAERESPLSRHTITMIGGAAFILYAYVLNGRNTQRMQEAIREVPQTSDIDIVMWYHDVIDKDLFLQKAEQMARIIREQFSHKERIMPLRAIIDQIVEDPSVIRTFEIEVSREMISRRFEHMTATINVNFIINGHRFKVVDIAIKNAIYSQHLSNESQRDRIPVAHNISYTDKHNTILLKVINNDNSRRISAEYVRVPKPERFVEQQLYAYGSVHSKIQETGNPNKVREYQEKLDKYAARVKYITQHILPSSPNASFSPSRGGKRRTYKKNKRHTKHHTARYTKRR